MASVAGIVRTGSSEDTGPTNPWTDPGNVTADDGTSAQMGLSNGEVSDRLRARNADLAAVPDGSTITGVVIEIDRRQSNGSGQMRDSEISLLVGGTVTGDNKAVASAWPSSSTVASYGSSADLWGTGGLTPAQVKDAQFGVAIKVTRPSGSVSNALVDFVRITVHYSTEEAEEASTIDGGGAVVSTTRRIAIATYEA